MRGSQDDSGARPISVAELLARNEAVGSPPVGGHRRRRRGNSDAVTVAELTGEIPIIRDEVPEVGDEVLEVGDEVPDGDARDNADEGAGEPKPAEGATDTGPCASVAAAVDEPIQEAAVVDEPIQEEAGADSAEDLWPVSAPPTPGESQLERSEYPRPVRGRDGAKSVFDLVSDQEDLAGDQEPESGAEQMSPDLVDDDLDARLGSGGSLEGEDTPEDSAYVRSYLRSTGGPLFGGQTIADDLARRRSESDAADAEVVGVTDAKALASDDEHDQDDLRDPEDLQRQLAGADLAEGKKPSRVAALLRGGWIVLQSIAAVAFGAGLFIAFEQMWMWNNIVALALSVLVIMGLVVGVWVVRKTEDIGSTLIAVAVGALVTFGPLALALLRSN